MSFVKTVHILGSDFGSVDDEQLLGQNDAVSQISDPTIVENASEIALDIIEGDFISDWENYVRPSLSRMSNTSIESSVTGASNASTILIDVDDNYILGASCYNVGFNSSIDDIRPTRATFQKNPNIGVKDIYSDEEKKSKNALSLATLSNRKVADCIIATSLWSNYSNTGMAVPLCFSQPIFHELGISYLSFKRMVNDYTSLLPIINSCVSVLPIPNIVKTMLVKCVISDRIWSVHRYHVYSKLMFHYGLFKTTHCLIYQL
jgi:hypothetical protein